MPIRAMEIFEHAMTMLARYDHGETTLRIRVLLRAVFNTHQQTIDQAESLDAIPQDGRPVDVHLVCHRSFQLGTQVDKWPELQVLLLLADRNHSILAVAGHGQGHRSAGMRTGCQRRRRLPWIGQAIIWRWHTRCPISNGVADSRHMVEACVCHRKLGELDGHYRKLVIPMMT